MAAPVVPIGKKSSGAAWRQIAHHRRVRRGRRKVAQDIALSAEKKHWRGRLVGIDIDRVAGTVSAGHLRVYRETGANRWLLILAIALNAALFALLLGYTIYSGPASTWITLLAVLALSFVFEVVYRKRTGRTLKVETALR